MEEQNLTQLCQFKHSCANLNTSTKSLGSGVAWRQFPINLAISWSSFCHQWHRAHCLRVKRALWIRRSLIQSALCKWNGDFDFGGPWISLTKKQIVEYARIEECWEFVILVKVEQGKSKAAVRFKREYVSKG